MERNYERDVRANKVNLWTDGRKGTVFYFCQVSFWKYLHQPTIIGIWMDSENLTLPCEIAIRLSLFFVFFPSF